MSVDSYFFASFQDNELAFAAIQQRLDERPSSDLPRVTSSLSLPTAPTNESNTTSILRNHSSSGPLGIKKIGSVLKPFISRGNDKVDDSDSSDGKSGFSIPFRSKSHKPSHDSLETLRTGSIDPLDEGSDGYPPRQSGPPPRGMHEEGGKGWSGWIKKPATKIFGTSPSQSSLPRRPSPDGQLGAGLTDTASTASTSRKGGLKRSSVTEVTVPAVPNGADSESEEEYRPRRKTRTGSSRKPRVVSFASQSSSGSQMAHNRSDYSMMEQSESGHQEDLETAKKFRNVFSLSEKEELIDRESRSGSCQADRRRLPGIPVPRIARVRTILRLDKLLLLSVITAAVQD